MKILKIFLGIIGLIILAAVLVLGYFGFVPGLSTLMGANKPKDLGVRYTKAEYNEFNNKINGDIIPITTEVDAAHSISYSGKIDVNKDFSQEEISSRLNYSRWKYMPISNVQVRINTDGSVELSANMVMDRLPGFIARVGLGQYSMSDVNKGLGIIKMLKADLPIYAKMKGSVSNNKLKGSIDNIQVGKFSIPLDKVNANETAISLYESITSKAASYNAKSVTFSGGKMHYEGTLPGKIMVETLK